MQLGSGMVFTVGLVLGMLLAVWPVHGGLGPALLCCGVGLFFCGGLCGYLVAAARQPVVVKAMEHNAEPVEPPPIASMGEDVYYMSPAGSRLHVAANCFQFEGAANLRKLSICQHCAQKKETMRSKHS